MYHNQIIVKSSLIAALVFACAFTMKAQTQKIITKKGQNPTEKLQAKIARAERYKSETTDPAMRAKYEQTLITLRKELATLSPAPKLTAAEQQKQRTKEMEIKRKEGEKTTNLPATDMSPKPLMRAN